MKLVLGLGNPGAEYDATRHNVGWWLLDRLAYEWGVGPFRQEGVALRADGAAPGGEAVTLLKPMTYMNRSGAALSPFLEVEEFDPSRDLLVLVDDAALDVGRVRFRPAGSAGGHNGLRSIQGVLGSKAYPRLRVGVGRPPAGDDLVEWVLSPMPPEDEDGVLELFPDLVDAVAVWIREGVDSTMYRFNR